MTPENFCYWLQGHVELNNENPTQEQWDCIKEHLQTVFKKQTNIAPGLQDDKPTPLDLSKLSIC